MPGKSEIGADILTKEMTVTEKKCSFLRDGEKYISKH